MAMGHGNCILALDVPYNAETVGDTALLFRKDPADLADKLRLVLRDPDLVRRLGGRARERAHAVYQWSDVIDGYERLFRLALAGVYRSSPPSDEMVPRAEGQPSVEGCGASG
jgi:glycosyltransferase involved in cell wall biosynthesis